ncbi:hypothetical protein CH72_4428 [Burkholderia ambifaria AMMD]|uniref:Uncharacterized protein n=1 Tax=Burkholderia ambifaria (strain ATCC BAA-244 / DSM 16087 / CCUG 44356 / LMG 19182 / AMMD) TaxID=339670 RepID=Q0B7C7_BURCM|nr:DUF2917 domain-containing protein [Burkholderia ambifaria]ABI89946.1 conserved hypothetical protein [Burkholderia ambifaria AMMD]AJY24820.1 hypothetical protein CH72_4428 [Burkholderia ambifaria AMMD]MBR7930487.1 DUF2917 domain-containing protein [Burkholderia ambifaria]MBR8345759.1 DUF2917 domain-containing protein [Burkholderia ambifaria]MBY4767074.1 DUF2917 domain-containing protein [Burkholderia ambifaria]
MDQASPLFDRPDRPDTRRSGAITLPTVVIRFAVAPRTTLTWRAPSDAEIRAHGAPLWITRPPSVDDYWVQPGDVLRIARGDRIWLGTDDDRAAEASITTAYVRRGERLRRTLAQVQRLLVGRWRRRD